MTKFGKSTLKTGFSAFVATIALVATVTPAVAQEGRARNSAQEATRAAERAARNARAQNPQYRPQQYRPQQTRQPQYRSPVRNGDERRARQSAYDARVAAERAEQRARNGGYRTPSSGYYQNSRDQEWRARESAARASRAAGNAGDRAYYENRRIEQRWNNGWRNDRRYNWQGYRNQYRDRYRMPTYYSPYRGRGYSRLTIGINLGSGYYGSRYWINDPYQYRLPPAPYGARWVRYYNDVVLVDTRSGYVMDVIRNFFW